MPILSRTRRVVGRDKPGLVYFYLKSRQDLPVPWPHCHSDSFFHYLSRSDYALCAQTIAMSLKKRNGPQEIPFSVYLNLPSIPAFDKLLKTFYTTGYHL